MNTPDELSELDKLQVAFEDVVQLRLLTIKHVAAQAGELPLDPEENTPLMAVVNAEAHIRYWKGVYSGEGGEKVAKNV